jgi:hypothetical protein
MVVDWLTGIQGRHYWCKIQLINPFSKYTLRSTNWVLDLFISRSHIICGEWNLICVIKHGCWNPIVNALNHPKLRNDEEPLPSHSSFLRCNPVLRSRDCTLCCSNSSNLARIVNLKMKHNQINLSWNIKQHHHCKIILELEHRQYR